MLPEIISIGPINISIFGIFAALAFGIFSFLLWRNLKEDYPDEEIITFTILITLFALLAARIFYIFEHFSNFGPSLAKFILFPIYPGFSLYGGFWGSVIFALLWSQKKSWDFWVLADNSALPMLIAVLVGSLGILVTASDFIMNLVQSVLILLVLLFALYIRKRYRKLIWYKSGKPGFVAGVALALFFVGNFGLDFAERFGLYLEGIEALLIAFLALIFLYKRSGRIFKTDMTDLFRFRKK